MFSKRIEEVIQASLVDGVISDKERQVIKHLAQQEGIDGDTVDVLLDARIQELTAQHKAAQRVCPRCGASIDAFSATCPYCGQEVAQRSAVSSMRELNAKLSRVHDLEQRRTIITSFPVPNTREDLLEFLSLSAANAKKTGGLLDKPIVRFLLVIAAFWLVFFFISIAGKKDPESTFNDYTFSGLLFMDLAMAFIVGSWFALRYAKKGGSKEVKEHNEMVGTWRTKFDQVMTKARLSLRSGEDIDMLDRLQREVHGK